MLTREIIQETKDLLDTIEINATGKFFDKKEHDTLVQDLLYLLNFKYVPAQYNRFEVIIYLVAVKYKVTVTELKMKSRRAILVKIRHAFYYWIRKNFEISLTEIGRLFNQDHATVINAVSVVENQYSRFEDIIKDLEYFNNKIDDEG